MPATITVTVTLSGGSWAGTPTIDTSKISFTCTHGHGPFTISSTGVSTDGATATVTLTMNRDLAKGEIIAWSAQDRWLKDGAGSYALAASGAEIVNNATAKTLTSRTQATSGGVTLTWTEPAEVRCTYAGVEIENPGSGVTVTGWTPATATDAGGRGYNLAVKNPWLRTEQGWDARGDATGDGAYDPAITASAPISLTSGDSLVIERGRVPDPYAKPTTWPQFPSDFGGFYVVDTIAADLTVQLPTLVKGAAHSPGLRTQYAVDFDTLAASFPTLSAASVQTPPWADLFNAVRRWPAGSAALRPFEKSGTTVSKRELIPYEMTAYDRDGYGEFVACTIGTAMCGLILNAYTTAQKARLAAHLFHAGQNVYEAYLEQSRNFFGEGGVSQAFYAPVMLYLYWTGQTAKIATLKDDIMIHELAQSYKVDAPMKAMLWEAQTRGSDTPWLTWRKVVRAVSGNSLTLGATKTTALLTDEAGVSARMTYGGAEMVLLEREDGTPVNASLGIVSNAAGGPFSVTNPDTVTVNVGDVVYMRPPVEPQVDDYLWCLGGPTSVSIYGNRSRNPLPSADYASEQGWLGQYLGLKGLGIWTVDHDFFGLMERCLDGVAGSQTDILGTNPFRTASADYSTEANTRTQHYATIKATASLLD